MVAKAKKVKAEAKGAPALQAAPAAVQGESAETLNAGMRRMFSRPASTSGSGSASASTHSDDGARSADVAIPVESQDEADSDDSGVVDKAESVGDVVMSDIKKAATMALGPGGSEALLTELIKTALKHKSEAKLDVTAAVELNAREQSFESAVSAGCFDLRTSIAGQSWSRAIKDPALKAKYAVVGRSYEQQRVFRAAWAASELQVLRSTRVHTESVTNDDDTSAQHVSIKKLMDDEGEVEAVVNHVFECTSRHAAGATFKGKPYLWWNVFTKRYDYLQVKRSPSPHSPLVPIRCNCVM
jgi:hypothetical protein